MQSRRSGEALRHTRQHLKRAQGASSGLSEDLEGWDGVEVKGRFKREGMCVYTELTHFAPQQKLMQHCKTIILQFKKMNKK